jgi:uncharacterized protein
MNSIVTNNLPEIKRLCEQYRVKSLYIFGSATSEEFNKSSDIDILIAFEEDLTIDEYTNNYFYLHTELNNLFGRNIDLLTENSISNPFLKESIEKSKKLLYAA